MMRNGCLILCQFHIPADVIFDYQRLVSLPVKFFHSFFCIFSYRLKFFSTSSLITATRTDLTRELAFSY